MLERHDWPSTGWKQSIVCMCRARVSSLMFTDWVVRWDAGANALSSKSRTTRTTLEIIVLIDCPKTVPHIVPSRYGPPLSLFNKKNVKILLTQQNSLSMRRWHMEKKGHQTSRSTFPTTLLQKLPRRNMVVNVVDPISQHVHVKKQHSQPWARDRPPVATLLMTGTIEKKRWRNHMHLDKNMHRFRRDC